VFVERQAQRPAAGNAHPGCALVVDLANRPQMTIVQTSCEPSPGPILVNAIEPQQVIERTFRPALTRAVALSQFALEEDPRRAIVVADAKLRARVRATTEEEIEVLSVEID